MFAQFFAGYLFTNQYLTRQQLLDGLKAMKRSRVKLGVLAMNAGYLTAEQIEEIHRKQAKVDMRFGELAVGLGYMSIEQVEELLSGQPSRHLLLAQALVDKEYMDNATFAKALNEFRANYDLTDQDMTAMDDERAATFIERYYHLEKEKNANALAEYIVLLFHNLIRFVGSDFVPVPMKTGTKCEDTVMLQQKMTGILNMKTVLEADEITFIQLASRFAGEEIPVLDEYSKAAGQDLMNLQNGLFLLHVAREYEIELKLHPVRLTTGKSELEMGMCCIPLMFSFGTVSYILDR